MIDIHTIGAGGGSIAWIDPGGALRVGPQSAGADPGPACYGAGGPLTLTDVNLLLGRLVPSRFPIPIDVHAARVRFAELRGELDDGRELHRDPGRDERHLRVEGRLGRRHDPADGPRWPRRDGEQHLQHRPLLDRVD